MLLDMIQWMLDIVGKLGPLAVAIAVFVTGRRQSRWFNQATVRAATVEDQKLRLALLDRRLKVIEHLRTARDTFGKPDAAVSIGAVLDALREAELVFDDLEREQLQSCLDVVLRYQSNYLRRFDELTHEQITESALAYAACNVRIAQVHEQLRTATRVHQVAPLTLPE